MTTRVPLIAVAEAGMVMGAVEVPTMAMEEAGGEVVNRLPLPLVEGDWVVVGSEEPDGVDPVDWVAELETAGALSEEADCAVAGGYDSELAELLIAAVGEVCSPVDEDAAEVCAPLDDAVEVPRLAGEMVEAAAVLLVLPMLATVEDVSVLPADVAGDAELAEATEMVLAVDSTSDSAAAVNVVVDVKVGAPGHTIVFDAAAGSVRFSSSRFAT